MGIESMDVYFIKKRGLKEIAAFGAGMLISDLIVDSGTGRKRARDAQNAEFERHINRRRRGRGGIYKDFLYSVADLTKDHAPVPPIQGQVWDAVKHRWTNPDNVGKTVEEVQGKKRIRGSGTGAHQRSIGGSGNKGIKRGVTQGRKYRGATDAGKKNEADKGAHPANKFVGRSKKSVKVSKK
jgi:hypothetical protein